jgi:hypothetical protein
MTNRTTLVIAVVALALVLAAAAACYQARIALGVSRVRVVAAELGPIADLLQEDQALIQELRHEPFVEVDSDILESYLVKLRRDGVAKHADMRQRLDQLADNNTAIVTLIKAYAPQAQTAAFTLQADKFRNYAAAWRDRWNSVMELFMAGGNYAASSAPFPSGFPQAVQAEIAAAK